MATDVSAALPDLILPPGATITVTMDDALAKVTLLNVYGINPLTEQPVELQAVSPMYSYGPDTP